MIQDYIQYNIKKDLIYDIGLFIDEQINLYKIKNIKNKEIFKKCDLFIAKYTKTSFISSVITFCHKLLNNPNFYNTLDNKIALLSFKNGVLDLKTSIFRKRVKEDYLLKYLDYDYNECDESYKKELLEMIYAISHNDNILVEFILSFFGYCMGFETKENIMLYTSYIPKNAKSIMCYMFYKSLPIYSDKIKNFCVNFDTLHKYTNKFEENDNYKLAFVHILISYAKKYYDIGKLEIPYFMGSANENDLVDTFLKNYCQITNNPNDKIHKDTFMDNYNFTMKQNDKWSFLLSKLKSNGNTI
jgi:hypothetical protein